MWPDRVSNPGPRTYESVPYRLRYVARLNLHGYVGWLFWV